MTRAGVVALHLMQASSAHTLTDEQALEDFHESLSHGADVVAFTEVQHRHDELRQACSRKGYQLSLVLHGDVAMAVKGIHKVHDSGEVASIPGLAGAHTARPVLWVSFQPFGTNEHVTAHTAHWPTKRSDTGHQQVQLADDMADVIKQHSQGARVSFWLGDTNNNDRRHDMTGTDAALRKGDLTSCWDELGRWPDTHGRATLDVIGSYDPDRRVSCARARVWPATHSDHRPVSAFYAIRPQRRP